MASSTVPAAKAALLALLQARPGLQGVQVEWAHPGRNIEDESLFFGTTQVPEEPATLGPNRKRNENFTLELVVSVLERGDEAQATEERAWALVAEIENAVRGNDTLGLSQIIKAEIVHKAERNYAGAPERVAEIVVQVKCQARI